MPMANRRLWFRRLPQGWETVLSPQFFDVRRAEIGPWNTLIAQCLMTLEQVLDDDLVEYFETHHHKRLCKLINKAHATLINDAWLNWLCDLYQIVPDYAKRFVLSILQWRTGSGEHQELSRVVAQISLSHPFKPGKLKTLSYLDANGEQLINMYRRAVKVLPNSRWLSDKLIRHSISRQLHYYPGDNSVLVPEKMLSGGPAFLHQVAVERFKTVIFDLVSTHMSVLYSKVDRQIEQGIKPELVKMLLADDVAENSLLSRVTTLYFFWLATHQSSSSGEPIWLCDQYRKCYIDSQPFLITCFITGWSPSPKARLPEQVIKEYFCQPDAEVVRGDDLLGLLEEFLELTSA